jgi:hypothetical protein
MPKNIFSRKVLQKKLEDNYKKYKSGNITEKEYLLRAKPIDMAIGKLEIATLQDTLVSQVTSLQHSQIREH